MQLTVQLPSLHWEAAHAMTRAAIQKAEELSIRVSVAVMDRGGNLLTFARHADAPFHTTRIAQDKATTAAGFGLPSRQWWDLLEQMDSPGLKAGLPGTDRFVVFGGGLPVYSGSDCVAGLGVSGGSEEEDEICARAALEAVGLRAEPDPG